MNITAPCNVAPSARRDEPDTAELSPVQTLLWELLNTSIILPEQWTLLPTAEQAELKRSADTQGLLAGLVKRKLLTEYQASRITAGKIFGLILGNYRVLDRLGAGGMSIIYRAEHVELRRQVAIKTLNQPLGEDPTPLQRFFAEMRVVAQLQHPNIVAAIDSGKVPGPDPDAPDLRYFVMEYVPGQDLEACIKAQGPLSVIKACDLMYQVASALAEAHKHDLVHRDIKPSNIQATEDGRAKLLDFGLARHCRHTMTDAGTMLGTVAYMAPEQATAPSTVTGRTDLYSLGGTLFWCLTGRRPFMAQGTPAQDFAFRMNQPPPSARALRPDVPAELDAVITRLMAVNPDDRYSGAQAVMRALLPFLKPELYEHLALPVSEDRRSKIEDRGSKDTVPRSSILDPRSSGARGHRILIVDDEAGVRKFCRYSLDSEEMSCDEAANGLLALQAIQEKPYDLVLLDVDMPEMNGKEVCMRLRQTPPCPHLKIIMLSGRVTADEMAQLQLAVLDDYLTKPLTRVQLRGRIKAALRLKDAQDRSARLNRELVAINQELERNLTARSTDLIHTRSALVLALAKVVECRDGETGAHLQRLQMYCRTLAEEASNSPAFSAHIDANFIELLVSCAPLHDIGKVGLPDHILRKPGKLDREERLIMQTHTVIGGDTLRAVAKQHSSAKAFLQMAIDIAVHHHERHDGKGYPDRLTDNDIPLAARLVAVGDVYDALRSRRSYKPALSHTAALELMMDSAGAQFDPALVHTFQRCAPRFERIFRDLPD